MERELILGGVGIGSTLILLIVLSLLQTSRRRREGAERLRTLAVHAGATADAPPGTTPFFVACYNGYNARFFRVYQGIQLTPGIMACGFDRGVRGGAGGHDAAAEAAAALMMTPRPRPTFQPRRACSGAVHRVIAMRAIRHPRLLRVCA